ncbi:glycoside hydrolase family 2 TIM barrel-domain containing protein [Draconibacterium sp. IB214405]|uniref:sugar-binding domain-containing protein n=1 Tax=Draconibacterium sp. IB214405 TaxID=3097352 RepID=UPI002A0B180B|nr:sugar-binding domain-containing protein [Draconibacterium sp. IB214405]MDX8339370.1 glycoside hydrolase family 2 TIM barrel-domain containing protein [Draconibacterium sp. IB214405]
MKRLIGFCIVLTFVTSACKQADLPELDLAGEWNYKLDIQEIGEKEKWFTTDFQGKVKLPGALRDYNIGDEPTLKTDWTGSIYDSSWYFNPAMEKYRQPGNVKFPFWLTPVKHYKGIAWFQKEVEIPASWEGKDMIVFLERPHWQTTVWIDSLEIGSDNSLSSPHQFIIPAATVSAGKHKLTIKVDNAIRDIDPGVNSSSLTDHTQGNWNGLVGVLKIYPVSNVRIDQLKLIPNLANKSIQVDVKLNSVLSKGSLEFNIKGQNFDAQIAKISKNWEDDKSSMTFEISMGEAIKTWSEFSPDLYEMTVSLKENSETIDTKDVQFGMREFTVNGKHFENNGIPVFLRGTTECCVFPLTGYPPTDKKEWTRIFNICKDFGLNHMRFHSYCPPEAAFCAADEAGIYLHVEGPSWAKYSTTLGDGKPIDDYLMKETKRILDTYGNHPSFVMMAYGNEPSGNYVPYLENWVDHFKAYDSQRVFTGMSSGRSWAIIENSDFIDRSPPRGLEWNNKQPESVFDYNNKTESQERPYVTFEMGQWCVFPNFDEIEKYTGSLKAKNFELFKEDLADHHMADLADDFLMASGKLQASCYKQEIEATLRTANLAGFQLLSLNDFPGQGSALVGVLDAFWDEKGYITANEFKRFCNEVVPLVCLPKFTFQDNETLKAEVEIANFSGNVLENSTVKWKLSNKSAEMLKEGAFEPTSIPVGQNNKIATLEIPLNFVEKAAQFTLSVSVGEYENSWKIWVYPVSKSEINKENIVIFEKPGPELEEALSNGKSVLLLAAGNVENGKDVVQYYVPAFWNTSWFRMRPPHTTGILIQNEHPVFDDFPTENYSDLQWWEISNHQQVMNLENFPVDFRPLVQPIDTWFMNRRLAMLFEAKVGNGKLMVCSADLSTDLGQRPVAGQLKQSILNYMKSDQFVPETQIDYEVIEELFEKKEREGWKSYVREDP